MAEEVKVSKVNFSLPFRAGMEAKPGYVSQVNMTSKTYPDEKVFAKFSFDLDNTIEVSDKDALEAGRKMLRQNKQRTKLIGEYASAFGVSAPGAAGGITKTDRTLLSYMGELTKDYGKIAAAFTKKTGKEITKEEVAEIIGA